MKLPIRIRFSESAFHVCMTTRLKKKQMIVRKVNIMSLLSVLSSISVFRLKKSVSVLRSQSDRSIKYYLYIKGKCMVRLPCRPCGWMDGWIDGCLNWLKKKSCTRIADEEK